MTNIKDKISRRRFLKLMGGTAAAATAAMTGCKEKNLSTEDDYKNQVEPPKGKMTFRTDRKTLARVAGAARSDVRNQRRIPPGGTGPQAAGCGRRERHAPERHGLRPEDRQPDARQPDPDRHPGSGRRSADGRPDTDPKWPRGTSGATQALLRP